MKKIFYLLCVLSVLIVTGCGGVDSSSNSSGTLTKTTSEVTVTYDNTGKVVSTSDETYQYDDNGNLVSQSNN